MKVVERIVEKLAYGWSAEELYSQAMEFYRQRPDKEWGITDCISFVVMQDYGLTDTLTTDEHFNQSGFKALLIE